MARKGLPKKYAKMGFKKGWAAYKRTKKSGGKKKASSPKKKSGSKKKKTYTKKKAGGKVTKKKFTQGDLLFGDAVAGPAVYRGLGTMETGNMELLTAGIPMDYTGYDPRSRTFEFSNLSKGWGGTINEVFVRKASRMTGVQAYPSKKSLVELGVFYAKDVMNAFDNQGDMRAFYRQHYKDYHGVDLGAYGKDAYQPLEMVDTRLPLWVVKQGKKIARNMGVRLPKWM